jgi:catechol 2,3-dioxygenase-like lactoylglutathione lyase family enzyme
MITIKKLDHIQICIPFGKEDEARKFYTDILNFKEIPKPKELLKNGGLWYEVNEIQFHIGCENELNNSKRHPAFEVENLKLTREYLIKHNVKIKEDDKIPNNERFSFFDPFNNRIEFLEYISE